MDPTTPPRIGYRPAEFAAAMGVGLTTIYAWKKAGLLKFMKIGAVTIIPASEVDRLVATGVARADRETAAGTPDQMAPVRAAKRRKPTDRRAIPAERVTAVPAKGRATKAARA